MKHCHGASAMTSWAACVVARRAPCSMLLRTAHAQRGREAAGFAHHHSSDRGLSLQPPLADLNRSKGREQRSLERRLPCDLSQPPASNLHHSQRLLAGVSMVRYFGISCSPPNRGQGIVADSPQYFPYLCNSGGGGVAHVHNPGNLPTALCKPCSSTGRLSPQRPIHVDKHAVQAVGPSPYSAGHADSLTSKICQLIAHMHGARAYNTFWWHPRYLSDPSAQGPIRLTFCCRLTACYSWYDALPL